MLATGGIMPDGFPVADPTLKNHHVTGQHLGARSILLSTTLDQMHVFAVALIAIAAVLVSGCEPPISQAEIADCVKRFGSIEAIRTPRSPSEEADFQKCGQSLAAVYEEAITDRNFYQKAEQGALQTLDAWVAKPKPSGSALPEVEEINDIVVPACARLVSLYATASERKAFPKQLREEWDFRVDFCSQGTVHRRWPQPLFENKELRDIACTGEDKLTLLICQRAGVRGAP